MPGSIGTDASTGATIMAQAIIARPAKIILRKLRILVTDDGCGGENRTRDVTETELGSHRDRREKF